MNTEQARFNMIEQQIRPWDVLDPHVLDLLAVVKREDFCLPAYQALAFVDMELPIGDVALGQVMLAPRVQARLLQDLQVKKHESVLQIGTGTGYLSALLGHRAGQVLGLEIDAALAQQARANLRKAGVSNVEVRHADGADSAQWQGGPFDVIVLCGSVAEIPPALLEQLKPGGRLAAIVGDEPQMRATFFSRSTTPQGAASFDSTTPWDCNAARLRNFAEPERFRF